MSLIHKVIDDNSISIIPEDADDLLNLRRIIKINDKIIAETTRVIKQDKEYSRPDRGERIRIKIVLNVEKISLDDVLDRLRVFGTIINSNNESVPHGTHHALVIKINESITITKKEWNSIEKKLVKSNEKNLGFVLVAIDISECGIGRIKGTHLEILPNIYSGSGGKQYKTNFNIRNFFEQVEDAILSLIKANEIIIFGPGETKKKFYNFLQSKELIKKYKIDVVEGIDSGGEDGIYAFTKSQIMREIMKQSKLAKVSSIIDEVMMMASRKSKRYTMGFTETSLANQLGAIESLVFSEKIIQTRDEDEVINLINDVENKGALVFGVDSTTDLGLRVAGLGGIISLLRFSIS